MAVTRQGIEEWIKRGIESKARWLIVVCDTYDFEDYPVFVRTVEEFDERYEHFNGKNMQSIMEVYDLQGDITAQLNLRRAWVYPPTSKFNPNRVEENPLLDWINK